MSAYTDLGGGLDHNPDTPPQCPPQCDGHGWTRSDDPDDSIPIRCPVHREHLVRRHARRPAWAR